MEELAQGVTPALDITPADDPFVRQLLAENARLSGRVAALERRLALYENTCRQITAIVQRSAGLKGGEG